VPLHLRFALALVAFAAAGSALATFAAPTGNGGSRGGYADAISAGSGLKLIRAANGATRPGADPEVLACRGVLHVGGLGIGARCIPPADGPATLASGD
jgi:hypothetical protein